MTTNSQLLTAKPKQKQKQTKQTTRTGTESQKWRSCGGISVGRERRRMGEKVQGVRSIKQQVQNRQVEVKNSMGNGEAKELICSTHGHELSGGMQVGGEVQGGRE